MLKRFALALTLSLLSSAALAANSTLSSLSSGVAVSNTDLFYDVQTVGSGGVKVTGTQLATFIFGKASGDCTATSGGVFTCLNTNGTAFGGLATLTNGSSTGTVIYWGGSSWSKLAGNSSGTQCLQETSAGSPSWGACGSGGNPGGSNTQLQYNNSSTFGGISGATTNGTAVTFGSSDLILSGSSSGTTTLNAASAAGTTTATLPDNTGTIAELNMGQTWSATQTFNSGDFVHAGSSSGTTTVNASATASGTLTLPAATDTLVARATTDTLTNKTITSSTNSLGGVTAAFGSDAKGDTYYNTGASNVIGNLAIGTTGQCLVVASGLPSWGSCGAGGTPGGANTDVQFNNSSSFGGDSGFTYAGSGQATLALGTITTNLKALNITGTWNASGTTFDAPIFENITNTLSASPSSLIDLQLGSASLFKVREDGAWINSSNMQLIFNSSFQINNGGILFDWFSGTQARIWTQLSFNTGGGQHDTTLVRDGATGTLGLVDDGAPTTATAFRVYNTTDQTTGTAPTNYERGVFDWTTTANTLTIGTQSSGTGTARTMILAPKALYSAAGIALPACAAGTKGYQAVVSDATGPTYNANYSSGGAVVAAVVCNGSNWVTQ